MTLAKSLKYHLKRFLDVFVTSERALYAWFLKGLQALINRDGLTDILKVPSGQVGSA